eukprot:TRINITY_DN1577_c1_g1_i2.p1 TRINITY_DN1577_c1_g1~~TRINITY_DN1577_c1_g1_i2.p1  ORF type:complete len:162 (+),score=27.93 TRINITY_DN1577_c1_g1_i2:238-723(+)
MVCLNRPEDHHGRILCEKWGLGKTIEMLALIASNPLKKVRPNYPNPGKPIPPWEKYITSAGTLIVAATSLVGQWKQEILSKSSRDFSILTYYGSTRPRNPETVAGYDIVLTTYGILQHERGHEMRDCLHQIDWHRIVLDESHVIKNRNSCTNTIDYESKVY